MTVYPGRTYFNEVDRGGHYAAWEEPEPFLRRGAGCIQLTALIEWLDLGLDQRGTLGGLVRNARGYSALWV